MPNFYFFPGSNFSNTDVIFQTNISSACDILDVVLEWVEILKLLEHFFFALNN